MSNYSGIEGALLYIGFHKEKELMNQISAIENVEIVLLYQ